MDHFVSAPVETTSIRPARQIIPREISGSLLSRTIIRWFNAMLQFLGRFTPEKMAVNLEHKLIIAGNPANLHAANYYALRFLLLVSGVILALIINRDFRNIDRNSLLLGFLTIVLSVVFPGVWLKGKVRSRQFEISRGLPDALDMLSVCASAGLGFDQSIQKISGYWETEFGRELKRVTQEMEMGISRSEALRNMSDRLDVNDLSRFIAIIIQAEKIGMSYADVLHSQALQMRVLRQYRAREIANKLPAKLIVPVALFIFPALLAVIMGPAIPILMNLF
jgi:tight adherence protein C